VMGFVKAGGSFWFTSDVVELFGLHVQKLGSGAMIPLERWKGTKTMSPLFRGVAAVSFSGDAYGVASADAGEMWGALPLFVARGDAAVIVELRYGKGLMLLRPENIDTSKAAGGRLRLNLMLYAMGREIPRK